MDQSIAPGLLLSMPHLHDPHFTRAVVLMIEHSDEGSFGLIINQPSNQLTVLELLEQLEITWRGDTGAPVWTGGPVMPQTGWVLHEPRVGADKTDTVEVARGIELSTSQERLREIAAAPPSRLRFLLGYAGWGPGQLAEEMQQGSWLHADAEPRLVFDTAADEMWATALQSIGVDPASVAVGTGVH